MAFNLDIDAFEREAFVNGKVIDKSEKEKALEEMRKEQELQQQLQQKEEPKKEAKPEQLKMF